MQFAYTIFYFIYCTFYYTLYMFLYYLKYLRQNKPKFG